MFFFKNREYIVSSIKFSSICRIRSQNQGIQRFFHWGARPNSEIDGWLDISNLWWPLLTISFPVVPALVWINQSSSRRPAPPNSALCHGPKDHPCKVLASASQDHAQQICYSCQWILMLSSMEKRLWTISPSMQDICFKIYAFSCQRNKSSLVYEKG